MNHSWIQYGKDGPFMVCELCGCGNVNPPPECRGAKIMGVMADAFKAGLKLKTKGKKR